MRVSSLRSLYGDDDMAVPRSRRVADVAAALLVSRAYTIFAGVQVVLNVALFVWVRSLSSRHGLAQAYPELSTVAGYQMPEHGLFMALEVWVNVALAGEIALRAAAQQREYIRYRGNWFDCAVLALSLVVLALLLSGNNVFDALAEELSLILLVVRYVIVLLRVVTLVKNQGATFRTAVSERVDLGSVGPAYDHAVVDLEADGRYHDDEGSPDEDEFGAGDSRSHSSDFGL